MGLVNASAFSSIVGSKKHINKQGGSARRGDFLETIVVAGKHIGALIDKLGVDHLMTAMIDELQQAFRGFNPKTQQVRTRDGFHYHVPALGLLEWMPCMHLGEQITVKMVAYHPDNPVQGKLPTILSTVHIYDPRTGHLRGLIDGTFLTALRTGAASCVASQILAKPDSRVVGIIGCGAQAVTQLHALSLHYDLQTVLIRDINPAAEASFAARVQRFLGPTAEVRPASVEQIVPAVDILVTATSQPPGEAPLFAALETRPGLHVNAVGSDFAGKVELPLSLLNRAFVCPDDRQQAMLEGECQRLTADQIGPELWELVQSSELADRQRQALTVFDSTGWALEDQVAGNLLLRLAQQHNLGERIQLERITRDPLNPYDQQLYQPQAVKVETGTG